MCTYIRWLKGGYLVVLTTVLALLLSKPEPVQAQRTLAYPFLPGAITNAIGMAMVVQGPAASVMNAQMQLMQAAIPAGMGVGGMMGMMGMGGMGMMGFGGMGMMGMGMGGMMMGGMGMMGMGGTMMGGMMGTMMGGMGMMGFGGMGMGGMMMGRGGFGGMGGFAGKGFGGFNGKKPI